MESKTKRPLDPLLQSSEYQPEANDSESVSEIALDSLSASEHLLIQTANSTYSFAVTDPAHRVGVLAGGARDQCGAATFLAGPRRTRADGQSGSSRLRVGSRAVFLVRSQNGVKRLITSAIVKLIRRRARPAESGSSTPKE